MKASLKTALGLAGLLAAISMGTSAQATTITVNMGGSSAATPFAQNVPLAVCDAFTSQSVNAPSQYINGDISSPAITAGKLISWSCTQGSNSLVIRYSATGSSDGYLKLQNSEASASSYMSFLDQTSTTGFTGPTDMTATLGGVTYHYNQYTGCTTLVNPSGSPSGAPVQIGWADVDGATFHQTGPLVPLTKVTPIDTTGITINKTAIVPFSFVLGNGVQNVNPATGKVTGLVNSLSQEQIIGLFSRNVTDWRQIGLGTAPVNGDGSPAAVGTAADATSPVTLCIRKAGSGTKATLDVTIMVEGVKEVSSGSSDLTQAADGVYFGGSTQDVRDCIQGNSGSSRPAHPHAIGYMEADQGYSVQHPTSGVAQGYLVRMDGYLPYDDSKTDPQVYQKCGKWKYFTIERLNTRTPSSSDPNVVTLINSIITQANNSTLIAGMNFTWLAGSNSQVTKNADPGPINFVNTPALSVCNGIN